MIEVFLSLLLLSSAVILIVIEIKRMRSFKSMCAQRERFFSVATEYFENETRIFNKLYSDF